MNWYVLYTLSYKTSKIIRNLNRNKDLIAFVPQYEVCQRKTKEVFMKPMFNNYIFVKTHLNQNDFNDSLLKMKEENDGLVKQLKNVDATALTEKEIEFFNLVLNQNYVLKLSHGYQEDGKTVITDGPLKLLEKHITKFDKHNQCAYLDLKFFNRRICMGIEI